VAAPDAFIVHSVAQPALRLRVRVGRCGPAPAALLVLERFDRPLRPVADCC
jgi:hypothetical protein